MKVIVKETGFYGGTWHEAGPKPQDILDAVAKPFMAPYGNQLEAPKAGKADEKKAG